MGDDGEIPEDYDYHYIFLDLLPNGWHDLILKLCADLKELLIKHNLVDRYRVIEVKEKWFMLRWYDYLINGGEMPQDIVDLITRYEEQSQYVCVICGGDKSPTKPCCTSCMAIYD